MEVRKTPKRKNEKPVFPVLEAEAAKRGILKRSIAECIGVYPRSLSCKLTGKSGFTLDEAIAIQERFFPDMDFKELYKKE